MSSQEQLLDLLVRWEEGRQQGREPTPEELCPHDASLQRELKQRIARTREFVESIAEASYAGAEERDIVIPTRAAELRFKGLDYLLSFALPNFYFHVSAVYMILRHNGVELGKRDFMG